MYRTVTGARILLDASRNLLQCRSFEGLADTALDSLQRLLGADSSCLALTYDSDDERHLYRARGCGQLTTDALQVYQQSYCRSDPVLLDILSHEWDGRERVVVLEHVVDMKQFRTTEIYAEFFRPQHIHDVLAFAVPLDDGARALFGVHRQRRDRCFEARHVAAVRDLLPSLAASFNCLLARERVEDREVALEELARGDTSEGIVVLDERARVMFADQQARERLRELRRRDPDLDASAATLPPHLRAHVLEAMATAHAGSAPASVIVGDSCAAGEQQLSIRSLEVSAERTRFLLTFVPDSSRGTHDPQLSSLTSRERQIAEQIARGLPNPEIARELNLSVRTIENHLRSIYSKLQLRNRASLAGLLCSFGAQPAVSISRSTRSKLPPRMPRISSSAKPRRTSDSAIV